MRGEAAMNSIVKVSRSDVNWTYQLRIIKLMSNRGKSLLRQRATKISFYNSFQVYMCIMCVHYRKNAKCFACSLDRQLESDVYRHPKIELS